MEILGLNYLRQVNKIIIVQVNYQINKVPFFHVFLNNDMYNTLWCIAYNFFAYFLLITFSSEYVPLLAKKVLYASDAGIQVSSFYT
jgi:hypothetical protein